MLQTGENARAEAPGHREPSALRPALAWRPVLVWVAACGLLVLNATWRSAGYGQDLAAGGGSPRYLEEMNIASLWYVEGVFPFASYGVGPAFFTGDPAAVAFRERLGEETTRAGIRPWQFWRTIPAGALPLGARVPVRQKDDRGRIALLALGFRLLGGVSPFLAFWLSVLLALPLLLWSAFEFQEAGHATAGAIALLAVGASPFVAETLLLAYSPAGFYLDALLALFPLSVHCRLGATVSWPRLLIRFLAVGLVLALCVACRGSTLLLLPGFLLAAGIAAWRLLPPRPRGSALRGLAARMGALAALSVILVAPAPLLQRFLAGLEDEAARTVGAHDRHNLWMNVWEGLGDFDRSKGYYWSDRKAAEFLLDSGERRILGRRAERLFRRRVLRDVGKDPVWYLGILRKRLIATIFQRKLWPWDPWHGHSIEPSRAPNEGHVDVYYALTTTVDWVGAGPRRVELPVPLLLLGAWLLAGWHAAARWRPGARWAPAGAGPCLGTLLCVAAAAIVTPVLVTTASALETEAFALVYFGGWGFLAEELMRLVSQRNAGPETSSGV